MTKEMKNKLCLQLYKTHVNIGDKISTISQVESFTVSKNMFHISMLLELHLYIWFKLSGKAVVFILTLLITTDHIYTHANRVNME